MHSTTLRIQRFTYDIIYYVLWVVEVILLLRFLLKLLGANPQNELVSFLYSASSALMGPFENVFDVSSIGNMVLDPSVLIAMVFYAIVAYALVSFIRMFDNHHTTTTTHITHN